MKVVIVSQQVPVELLDMEQKYSTVYSTMAPVKSPYFKTRDEVHDWYNNLPMQEKMIFVKAGYFAIYFHQVANTDMDMDFDGKVYYHAKQGEVLSTDESAVYDFKGKTWL